MTAETIYRIISIAFLVLGLLAFIRASRLLAEADMKKLEAKCNLNRIEDITNTVPGSFHWVNDYQDQGGILVIANHGIETAIIKRIPCRNNNVKTD